MKWYWVVSILIYCVSARGWSRMHEKCFAQTNCQTNPGCQAQISHCSEGCSTYVHRKQYYECLDDCMNNDFQESQIKETQDFMSCIKNIIQRLEEKKQLQSNQFDVISRKQLYSLDKYAHTGGTFQIINCQKYIDNPETKKKVIIKSGKKQKMIFKYFESRCDFFIQTLEETSPNDTSFFLKWTDYAQQQNFTSFQAGSQIVNHIPNSRFLLSDKNRFVITMSNFDQDKNNPYKIRSKQIHFKTYLFDLESEEYNPQELEFFNEINSGYWLAKDPYGSLGIHQFNLLSKKKRNGKKVIQQYLANPFLLQGRKFDIRSYVLIASLDPFVVLYQNGFIKKCIQPYDLNFTDFDEFEAMKHLTNRSFQKKNQNYTEEAEDLMMNISQYEDYLKQQEHFSQEKVDFLWGKGKKTVAYSILAAKKNMVKKRGYFQLLGIDLIFDEQFNAYIIEYNTSAGLFMDLSTHHLVIPQLLQSTLDLILDSHRTNVNLYQYWSDPHKIDLGLWEILYNEATGYDFLEIFEKTEKEQENLLFGMDQNTAIQTDL